MKDRWSQLSLKDKSDLMSLYIRNGISSLEEIKKHYNSFATGGQINTNGPDDPEEDKIYIARPLNEVQIIGHRNPAQTDVLQQHLDNVNSFYYNDVVPRLQREHQGLRTKPDINFPYLNIEDIDFNPKLSDEDKTDAYVNPILPSKIHSYVNPESRYFDEDMTHENSHRWQFEHPKRDKQYKDKSKEMLRQAYGNYTNKFRNTYKDLPAFIMYGPNRNVVNNEYEADNRAVRYNIWREYRDLYHRTPTIEELDKYIDEIPALDLYKKYIKPSGYLDVYSKPPAKDTYRDFYKSKMEDFEENVQKVREALKHVAQNNTTEDTVHYAALGGHLYQDGGPDDDKYSFLRIEPAVAVADNTRVVTSIDPYAIAQAKAEYETQQRQAAIIKAAQNQPQLRADTRTDSDRKIEAQRREKQAKLDAIRAAQRDFMSLGRPSTEAQQAAVMTMPYVAEAASNYLRNSNIARDLGYFVPGISNVLMAQDANQSINNGQYGWAALSGLGALSPVAGLTPNFKSSARYSKSANKVGDWTILDYGRTKEPQVTTQSQLTSKTTLQLIPTRNVDVTPTRTTPTNIQQLSYNSIRGIPKTNSVITPKQINLPEKFVNFVDKNGNIDTDRFTEFWKYVANQYGNNFVDKDRIVHSINVAKSAQQLPLPKGVTRKDYVQAALLHDIGTAIEGHSDTHGQAGANVMKKIAGTQLSPAQYEAIEKHMDNTSYGKGRDLLKAVEAADAARGKNLAEALVFHPNLMTYKFEPQFNYTGQKAAENFRDDLKSRVNPILKQTGLGTIPLNSSIQEATQLLNDKTRQWRTLLRGARDPKGTSMSFGQERRNIENAEKLAKKYYGEDIFNLNPEFYRTLITTQTIPLEDSGGGRAGFRDARHALDLDKNIYDALYASNSASVATGYKTGTGTNDGRLGLARKVYLPFEEYSGEMLPSEWMIDNFDWDLLDQNRKSFKSGEKQYGLTRFSQFDIPYRLQTGKSFMTDYGNFIGKQNMFDVQKTKLASAPYEMTVYYNSAYKDINEINNILNNFGFKSISPFNEDASIIYRIPKNNTLKRLLNDIIDLPDDSLKNINDQTVKDKAFFALSDLKAYDLLSKAQYQKRNYLKFDKRNLIKKALDEYYTKQKAQFRPTPIFKDQGNMMEFMLKQGVEPRVLNKNFLSTLAVNTGGKPLPEGSPLFFKKDRDSNQLSIIAPKGSKVFEDLGELDLDDYFNGVIVGKRHDFGHRSFGVTTKFNNGGKLNGR